MHNLRHFERLSFADKLKELKERSRDFKLQAQELNERQTEVDRDSVFQSTHPFCERINNDRSRNIAYSERVAKSMLAMAQLSHIIAKANGDWVADWKDESQKKSTIVRVNNEIRAGNSYYSYSFLAFKSPEIRALVFEQNENLINDFYLLD